VARGWSAKPVEKSIVGSIPTVASKKFTWRKSMNYLITVKIRFDGVDDVEGRQKMKQKFAELGIDLEKVPEEMELKFQRINKNSAEGLQI
jgi:hypothetical protein